MTARPHLDPRQLLLRLTWLLLTAFIAAPTLARPHRHRPKAPAASKRHVAARPVRAHVRPPAPALVPSAIADDVSETVVAAKGPATAAELKAILLSAPGKPVAVGLILDAATGEVVMDLDSKRLIYPASVTKLFSTAAVLRTLRPDKVLVTEVRGSVARDGIVDTVALVGAGDPTMAATDYGRLADALKAAGIVRIGRLVADGTAFDDKLPKGFEEKQTDAAYRAPIGGLQADVSTVSVVVRPGKVGEPPNVDILPACSDAVLVKNEARTVQSGKDTLSVITRPSGRRTEVVITGVITMKHKPIGSGRRRVADASLFAAGVFRAALQRRGIEVLGDTAFARAPDGLSVLASRNSPTIAQIATTTNKISQNQYAETLFKLVGLQRGGAPASADKAVEGVKQALADFDIHWQGGVVGNGSGLYHATRVPAAAVVELLRGMARDTSAGPIWRATLAIGGKDGTLRGRLHGPATQGRVFAKTGTLDDVVALAGYAEGPHRNYVFALFYNEVRAPAGLYRAVHDRLLRRLLGN